MALRSGKRGQFYGCTAYPSCVGTRPYPYIPASKVSQDPVAVATRAKLKAMFDKFCQERGMGKTAANQWIKDNLGREDTDISKYDAHTCQLLAAYMKVENKEAPAVSSGPTEMALALQKAQEKYKKRKKK
jgi:ssDNA-binding Zn-finger/Zn-ribbon topoisomerase 1